MYFSTFSCISAVIQVAYQNQRSDSDNYILAEKSNIQSVAKDCSSTQIL
jgi:hypothetical protein